jgi:hypothetical protein
MAAGVGDAEATLQKELARLLPDASVDVREIRRSAEGYRAVEEFAVSYEIRVELARTAPNRSQARHLALREVRGRLRGTLFERVNWEEVEERSS